MSTTLTRRIAVTAAAATTLALGPLTVAQAAPAPERVMPANAVTDCLSAGKIWLVVDDHTGKNLHNTCVEKGANGQALLESAGVKVTKDAKGFICQMDSEPAACPAKFDGNFWQYYTAKQGGKWEFSQKGASESTPVAGTLEGWCYGKQCTPTMPSLTAEVTSTGASPSASATPAAGESASQSSKTGLWVGLGALALLVVAGAVAAMRRRKA